MLQHALNKGIVLALAGLLVLVFGLAATGFVEPSLAEEDAAQIESQVRQSAQAYNDAVSRQEALEAEIAELDARIAGLEERLPAQQRRSDESVRALYKYEYDTGSVLMMMLESSSVTDMLAILDSYNWIIDYNTSEINTTIQMQNELKEARANLESTRSSAQQAAEQALASLKEAQTARERMAARAAAIQAAEQAAARDTLNSSSATDEEKQAASSISSSASSTSVSNVGWSADKTQFVNKWAPRINNYLAGSPMAGTGKAYAAAAWDNGVDPRWAPAISYVESSKGAVCYRSHNAWGYGGYSFGSWEEGINRVVGALGGSMYGGYLTREAAATYCPTNPDHWYNSCAEQMAQI